MLQAHADGGLAIHINGDRFSTGQEKRVRDIYEEERAKRYPAAEDRVREIAREEAVALIGGHLHLYAHSLCSVAPSGAPLPAPQAAPDAATLADWEEWRRLGTERSRLLSLKHVSPNQVEFLDGAAAAYGTEQSRHQRPPDAAPASDEGGGGEG
jgi:hypothetical protein